MRSREFITRGWPHLVIVLATAVGWLLGSPRYGFPIDDDIDGEITAEAIETLYAEEFAQLSALHAATDETEKTRLRSELDAAFAANELIVRAAMETRRDRIATAHLYNYSTARTTSGAPCTMSTPEQLRAGLMRCDDVLMYTRAIERRDETWVLAILTLDYALLRQRVR